MVILGSMFIVSIPQLMFSIMFWSQLVKSVFPVHLKHAQVTVNLAVHVKDVLAIYGAAISFIDDHCVGCNATAQMSSGDGVGMDLSLLEYLGQLSRLSNFKHLY